MATLGGAFGVFLNMSDNRQPMRILHVVDSLGTDAAGVSAVAGQLIRFQRKAGVEVGYVTGDGTTSNFPNEAPATGPLPARIWRCIEWANVVHIHGLWSWSTLLSGHMSIAWKKPYVITPHGMLDDWALRQSQWKKRVYRWISEDRVISHADTIHALCLPELNCVRGLGFSNPVVVIPPGIEDGTLLGAEDFVRDPLILFLGRLHRKKGIDVLLAAFHALAADYKVWRLVIAGPDESGIQASLAEQARQASLAERVAFVGPVYGEDKERLLRSASIFALPSYSEGVPVAVLEAMANGVPVAVSGACNLPEIADYGAGLIGTPDAASVACMLKQLMLLSDSQRREMGRRGCALVATRFAASSVSARLLEVYEKLLR